MAKARTSGRGVEVGGSSGQHQHCQSLAAYIFPSAAKCARNIGTKSLQREGHGPGQHLLQLLLSVCDDELSECG